MVPVIVKIDIEGAEAKALGRDTSWADDVPLIVYEQHDPLWHWLGPWQGCGHAFEAMLSRRVRERLRRGGTIEGGHVVADAFRCCIVSSFPIG